MPSRSIKGEEMISRLLPVAAGAGTLGLGMLMGSMVLAPASATSATDDSPQPEAVAAVASGLAIASGEIAVEGIQTDCAAFDHDEFLEPPSLDGDPFSAWLDEERHPMLDGSGILRTSGRYPSDAAPLRAAGSAEDGCIDVDCAVVVSSGERPSELKLPADELMGAYAITEADGRITVTDANGDVLYEGEAPADGTIGFAVIDGEFRLLDDDELPTLGSFGFETGSLLASCDGSD